MSLLRAAESHNKMMESLHNPDAGRFENMATKLVANQVSNYVAIAAVPLIPIALAAYALGLFGSDE